MTALSASRNTSAKHLGDTKRFLAADSQTFYHGGLAMLDSSGLLRPAAALLDNLGCVGVIELDSKAHPDGSVASGTAGTTYIDVREGLFNFVGATLGQDDVGKQVYAVDDQTIDETPIINLPIAGTLVEYIGASEGWLYTSWKHAQVATHGEMSWHVKLATLADGDIITDFTPGFAGVLLALEAHVTDPATTAAKLSTLGMDIGATAVTGGLALTSANMTPLGAVVAQALSAATFFNATDTLTVTAASTTAFVEGEIMIKARYKQLSK